MSLSISLQSVCTWEILLMKSYWLKTFPDFWIFNIFLKVQLWEVNESIKLSLSTFFFFLILLKTAIEAQKIITKRFWKSVYNLLGYFPSWCLTIVTYNMQGWQQDEAFFAFNKQKQNSPRHTSVNPEWVLLSVIGRRKLSKSTYFKTLLLHRRPFRIFCHFLLPWINMKYSCLN